MTSDLNEGFILQLNLSFIKRRRTHATKTHTSQMNTNKSHLWISCEWDRSASTTFYGIKILFIGGIHKAQWLLVYPYPCFKHITCLATILKLTPKFLLDVPIFVVETNWNCQKCLGKMPIKGHLLCPFLQDVILVLGVPRMCLWSFSPKYPADYLL